RHTRFSRDWSSDVCSSDLRPCGDVGDRVFAEKVGAILQPSLQHAQATVVFVGIARPGIVLAIRCIVDEMAVLAGHRAEIADLPRSEERRVGKESRSGWTGR